MCERPKRSLRATPEEWNEIDEILKPFFDESTVFNKAFHKLIAYLKTQLPLLKKNLKDTENELRHTQSKLNALEREHEYLKELLRKKRSIDEDLESIISK